MSTTLTNIKYIIIMRSLREYKLRNIGGTRAIAQLHTLWDRADGFKT